MLPPKNGKLDVGGALGQGVMTVIKDMGLKEPYSGQTILQTGEIAEDLTYYFATSEQVPSSVGLGVLMEKDNTVRLRRRIYRTGDAVCRGRGAGTAGEKYSGISGPLQLCWTTGIRRRKCCAKVLEGLDAGDHGYASGTCFPATVPKQRIEKAIISIGKKEIQSMIDDGKDIEVKCHFCNTAYNYTCG